MKFLFFITILYLGRVAFSCHKSPDPINTSSSVFVNLKTCSNKTLGSETVKLCLDSVLQDSRCPRTVQCVWAGIAVAKFSFTNNGVTYPLTLGTSDAAGYRMDTVLAGYKIKFVNLSPYPGTYTPPVPANQTFAEVQITK